MVNLISHFPLHCLDIRIFISIYTRGIYIYGYIYIYIQFYISLYNTWNIPVWNVSINPSWDLQLRRLRIRIQLNVQNLGTTEAHELLLGTSGHGMEVSAKVFLQILKDLPSWSHKKTISNWYQEFNRSYTKKMNIYIYIYIYILFDL